MNIYLDIDGVLLAKNRRAADYADEFLQFVVKQWPDTTYWLTTYCWHGQDRAYEILQPFLRKKTLDVLHKIKTAEWDELKTDAIDFKRPFLWYDTTLYREEEAILEHYQALGCLRKVNLETDQFQLLDELVHLRSLT